MLRRSTRGISAPSIKTQTHELINRTSAPTSLQFRTNSSSTLKAQRAERKKSDFLYMRSLQRKAQKQMKGAKVDLKFLPKEQKPDPLQISQADGTSIHFRPSESPYRYASPVDKSRRLLQQRGNYCKLLVINRPERNNAIDLTAANVTLQEFRELNVFPGVQAVVLTGGGETAFSTGVDWKEILTNKPADARKLLREDSKLAFFLATCSLRTVSVMRGLASGSGITMAAFNDFSIATPGTRCDWPEPSFGMCLSAGNSFILSRVNAKFAGLGTYAALTGTMIRGEDVMLTAISNDFGGDFAATQLIEAFSGNPVWDSGSFARRIKETIGFQATDELSFYEHLGAIKRCFHFPETIEEVFEALEAEGTEWAQKALAQMRSRSPLALKVVFRQIWKGADLDLPGCFQMDFRLVNRLMRKQDFKNAAAIKFNGAPAKPLQSLWKYKSVADVPDDLVDSMFQPLTLNRDGVCDLILPDEVYLEHPIANQLKLAEKMGRIKVESLPDISAEDIAKDYIMAPPTRILPEALSALEELQVNIDGRPLEKVSQDAHKFISQFGVSLSPEEVGPYVRMMALDLGLEPKFVMKGNWATLWMRMEEISIKKGIELRSLIKERDVQGFLESLKQEKQEKKVKEAEPVTEAFSEVDVDEMDEEEIARARAQLRASVNDLEYDDEAHDAEFEQALGEEEQDK